MKKKLPRFLDHTLFIISIILLTSNSFYFVPNIFKVILLLVIFLYFSFRLISYVFIERKLYYSKIFLIVIILIVISSLWSGYVLISLEKSFFNIVIPSLLILYYINKYKLINVLKLTFIIGLIIGLSSIFMSIFIPRLGVILEGVYIGYWKGIFPNKNLLAVSSAFHLIITLFLFLISNKSINKFIYFLGIIMNLLLVIKAGSSTSILTLLFSLLIPILIYYVFEVKNNYLFISMIVFTFLFLVVISTIIITNMENITILFNRDLTFTGRTIIWEVVINLILQKPFLGYGYGAFWEPGSYTYNTVSRVIEVVHAHNGFLDIITSIGFTGFILIVLSIIIYIKNNLSLIFRARNKLYLLPLVYILFFLTYNLSESFFLERNSFLWAYYFYFYHYLVSEKQ